MVRRIEDTSAEPVAPESLIRQMLSVVRIRLGESRDGEEEDFTLDPDVSDMLDRILDDAMADGMRKATPGPSTDIVEHLSDVHTESLESYSLEAITALDGEVQKAVIAAREWGKKAAADASAEAPNISSAQLRRKERALRLAESKEACYDSMAAVTKLG